MNEIEAVIDTNIFISALIGRAKSIPKVIINALYERKFSLVISLPLIRELEETLQDPKTE
ncbi:MAG: putative toxin-antitoxin system toxin component, PIN family [Candidatus Omnitrophica bacterium]|nr:putative toxin-antitoxin system toxin component, PIN family [Candidatus Omnitrophota bacterium]